MKYLCLVLATFFYIQLNAQHAHNVYEWNNKKDPAIVGGAVFTWLASQYLKSNADKITLEDLPLRDPDNLWFIDKGATNNYSKNANKWSDVFLYSSFALPFTHYSGKICRDEGSIIAAMALETFFITDALTNLSKAFVKRFRPFTYNPDVPLDVKLSNGARYSFMSGHASNTAALGWFTAKVYSDLYPDSKWKPVIWTLGITLPATTSYLRHKAGKHFPTDVMAGYLVGATIGYLVPHFHKTNTKDSSFQIWPSANGVMLMFTHRIH